MAVSFFSLSGCALPCSQQCSLPQGMMAIGIQDDEGATVQLPYDTEHGPHGDCIKHKEPTSSVHVYVGTGNTVLDDSYCVYGYTESDSCEGPVDTKSEAASYYSESHVRSFAPDHTCLRPPLESQVKTFKAVVASVVRKVRAIGHR